MDKQRFEKIKQELFHHVRKPQRTPNLDKVRKDSHVLRLRPKTRTCDLCLNLVEDPMVIHRILEGKITRTCGLDRSLCPDKTRNKFTKYK